MLVKCGADLIKIDRISNAADRLGDGFLQRIWTAEELAYCLPGGKWLPRTASSLAARFAAKEAMAKALGTGIGRNGVKWLDLSVRCGSQGAPEAILDGAARQAYEAMGGRSIAISLSHDAGLAQAFCVLLLDRETAGGSADVV